MTGFPNSCCVTFTQGDTTPLSNFPRQWKASPRGHRLSSSHSIFISPYKPKTTPPRTPGLCYYFNSSLSEVCGRHVGKLLSGHTVILKLGYLNSVQSNLNHSFLFSQRLHEINNMIKTAGSPNKRCHMASLDKEEEVGEDGASAKRLRLDDQSAWQRRLRNVVNERVARGNRDQESPDTQLNQYKSREELEVWQCSYFWNYNNDVEVLPPSAGTASVNKFHLQSKLKLHFYFFCSFVLHYFDTNSAL